MLKSTCSFLLSNLRDNSQPFVTAVLGESFAPGRMQYTDIYSGKTHT